MIDYLIPWYEEAQNNGGLKCLSHQIGDYNILYQSIIALFTYFDFSCIYAYKILSCVFDYILAFSCGYIFCRMQEKEWKNSTSFVAIYTIVLLLPTVFLDSAFWGQCDSIYVTFLVWTIYFLYIEKYTYAFLIWGVAFAFKFQSIFILPFILIWYVGKKNFSIFNILYTVLVFWLSGLLGIIYGRSIFDGFRIYIGQTGTYENMFMNYPSFWSIIGTDYKFLHSVALVFTVAVLGIGMYISVKYRLITKPNYLYILVWSLWAALIFLPAMHERYSYSLDIFLIMLCVKDKKCVLWAIAEIIISMLTYGNYLFKNGTPNMGLVNICLWVAFSVYIMRNGEREEQNAT